MLVCNRVPPDDASSGQTALGLLEPRVHRLQTVQSLAELRRQTLVGGSHVDEQRVTAARGTVQQVQEGRARGLLLVGDVRVPCHRVGVLLEELEAGLVVGAAVDEMDLREPPGRAGGRVDVVSAKVAAELEGLLDGQFGKVLVTEDCMAYHPVRYTYVRQDKAAMVICTTYQPASSEPPAGPTGPFLCRSAGSAVHHGLRSR